MIELTSKKWGHIQRVNRVWNDKIQYESDSTHYGKKEWWCFPDDLKGDCEDYAVAKRQALESFDIPGYFATCWCNQSSDGRDVWYGYHAVLIVDTDRGDFVLSNGFDEVYSYHELPWKWHKKECEDRKWRKILS